VLAGIMLGSTRIESPYPDPSTPPLQLGQAVSADLILALLDSEPAQRITAGIAALHAAQPKPTP